MASRRDNDAMFQAAKTGDEARLRDLLASGASPNISGGFSMTPLHYAAQNGHEGCVRMLLAAGASLRATEQMFGSVSPLHAAIFDGHVGCAQALVAAGADLHAVTGNGESPLQLATRASDTEAFLQLLLDAGASVTATNQYGRTALQHAAALGRVPAVYHLMLAPQTSTSDALSALRMLSEDAEPLSPYPLIVKAIVARIPLTEAEWQLVPHACQGLGAALHVALNHSPAQAQQLVQRLGSEDVQRLRAALLGLARLQRRMGAELPSPILSRILADLFEWPSLSYF